MKYLCIIAVLAAGAFAMSVEEIVKKMEEAEYSPHSKSKMKQTITISSGKQRTFSIEGYSFNGTEKQLQVYTSPARVNGEKILMLNQGDDIWTYSPKTMRVRHLATHMKKAKVMGSDFSYEDFGGGNYLKKFKIKKIGEEKQEGALCYKLELLPTQEGPSYKKELVWVAKSDYIPRRVDYYDEDGLTKTLIIEEVKTIQDKATPTKYVMRNIREGGQTSIEILEIDYKTKLKEAIFTERGLKK